VSLEITLRWSESGCGGAASAPAGACPDESAGSCAAERVAVKKDSETTAAKSAQPRKLLVDLN
jgi:hypothetical protein